MCNTATGTNEKQDLTDISKSIWALIILIVNEAAAD